MAAKPVILTVGPQPFAVFINFVRGDEQTHAELWRGGQSGHQVHCAHNIGVKCLRRFDVTGPHQWLCSQMQSDFGIGSPYE